MNYFFLGIGGIGMSALARFFNQRGDTVSGYDRTPSPLTHQLEAEGIAVHYEDNVELIPQSVDLVIYTPAIPKENQEYQYLLQSGVRMMKRSQMLGELTRGKKCIAVAGSHGKTTTSTMIAYILNQSHLGCSAFLGGISKNFDSNMVVDNHSEWVVVEADEYDRSFLQLHPFYSVITATDPDHLDIYGTHENLLQAFEQYANQTVEGGMLFLKEGLAEEEYHHHSHEGHEDHGHRPLVIDDSIARSFYTGSGIEADYYPFNVRNYSGTLYFDLHTPEKVFFDVEMPNSCLYNVENAVVASAVALACGVTEEELRQALKTFCGIRRRFDYRIHTRDLVFIDDYAHHPEEIRATLDSIRYLYPGKRVVGIFQPHLFSRTADLADEFAEVLSTLDEIVLMPIYPAREKPIPGVTSAMLLHKIQGHNKYLCTPEQVLQVIPALYPDVVVTLGAGDIDRIVPQLEKVLSEE